MELPAQRVAKSDDPLSLAEACLLLNCRAFRCDDIPRSIVSMKAAALATNADILLMMLQQDAKRFRDCRPYTSCALPCLRDTQCLSSFPQSCSSGGLQELSLGFGVPSAATAR